VSHLQNGILLELSKTGKERKTAQLSEEKERISAKKEKKDQSAEKDCLEE